MSQNSSGEKSLVDKRLEETVAYIDKQYAAFKLNEIVVDESVVSYLNMSEKELYALSPEELAIAELKLHSYAFAIQKFCNQATTIKNWADKCIGRVVAAKYSDYNQFTKYEVIRCLVIKTDTHAAALDKIVEENELIINQFMYLSQTVQHVADAFGKLARFRGKNDSIR
jgi:uroporphyrinogen-III decarboxylase